MSEATYFLLKMAFLGLMWFFVFSVIFAIRSDLFGPRVRVLARSERKRKRNRDAPEPSPVPTVTAPSTAATAAVAVTTPVLPSLGAELATAETAKRLTITQGPRAGHEFVLANEPITIGRSLEASLVLRDDYTSTNHARIFLHNGTWTLEDQGSTNGTLLDGTRVTDPTPIPLNTPISVGTSVLELRR